MDGEENNTNEKQENGNSPVLKDDFLDIRSPVFSVKEAVVSITDSIKDGKTDPLKAAVILKRMEKIHEEVKKDPVVKEMIRREADKHLGGNQKSFDYWGAKIAVMPTYTWYDFSECKHPELDELMKIKEFVDARIKEVQEELKLLIPKENAKSKAFGQMSFGIPATNKGILVETLPKLTIEPYNEIAYVEPPRKVQGIGLKFMKI